VCSADLAARPDDHDVHHATAAARVGGDLHHLRPGAMLRLRGAEYVLERSLRLEQGDLRWTEHRLSSDASGRSLWLEVPDEPLAPLSVHGRGGQQPPLSRPVLPDPDAGFVLRRAGTARYRTIERAGISKIGTLIFVEYIAGARLLSFERHHRDEPWQIWHGRVLDRSAVELLRR